MKIQLPLTFFFKETLSFDNFIVSNNNELIRALKMMVSKPGPQSVFVWGLDGSGRSHLCQALYQLAEESSIKAAYLALSEKGIEAQRSKLVEQASKTGNMKALRAFNTKHKKHKT